MRKILICDDDTSILEMTSLCLSMQGFEVITQANSMELIQQAVDEKPDLLLIDLWMPMLPGDELARQVKQDSRLSHIPIIIFSAALDGRVKAASAGVLAFISKPFDLCELADMINFNIAAA